MRKMIMGVSSALLMLVCMGVSTASADSHLKNVGSEVDVTLSGWARAEYGISDDRYGEENGDDHFGISRAALVTEAAYENAQLTAVLGTTIMSDESDDDLGFKELYLTWSNMCDSGTSSTWGVQPLLFGLKPSGYDYDRSIVPSLEYGGAGGFAVAHQDGAIIRGSIPLGDVIELNLAAFDTSESTIGLGLTDVDGSSIWDNGMVQVRASGDSLGGFYAAGGIEGRYVGGATDSTKTIYFAGVGFTHDMFDISAEFIGLDAEITGTADDETYVVTQLTITALENIRFIVDWATSDEAEVDTMRAGVQYDVNEHVEARIEYAGDFYDGTGTTDVSSVDGRITFTF